MTKKALYISLFIVLGALLSFLAHAYLEIWYIRLLLKDFSKYSLGFSWKTIFIIHYIGGGALFLLGTWAGFMQGKFWWQKIYVEKKLALFRKRFFGR